MIDDKPALVQCAAIEDGSDLLVQLFLSEFSEVLRPFCFVYDRAAGTLQYTSVASHILSQLGYAVTNLSSYLQDVPLPFPESWNTDPSLLFLTLCSLSDFLSVVATDLALCQARNDNETQDSKYQLASMSKNDRDSLVVSRIQHAARLEEHENLLQQCDSFSEELSSSLAHLAISQSQYSDLFNKYNDLLELHNSLFQELATARTSESLKEVSEKNRSLSDQLRRLSSALEDQRNVLLTFQSQQLSEGAAEQSNTLPTTSQSQYFVLLNEHKDLQQLYDSLSEELVAARVSLKTLSQENELLSRRWQIPFGLANYSVLPCSADAVSSLRCMVYFLKSFLVFALLPSYSLTRMRRPVGRRRIACNISLKSRSHLTLSPLSATLSLQDSWLWKRVIGHR